MSLNLNELKNVIKDQLDKHLTKLKSNKELKQTVENEIEEIIKQITRLIIRQKIELLKQINEKNKIHESNLSNLIRTENDILTKIENNNNNQDEILHDYNQFKLLSSNINFDFVFKKNENIEKYLIIGDIFSVFKNFNILF